MNSVYLPNEFRILHVPKVFNIVKLLHHMTNYTFCGLISFLFTALLGDLLLVQYKTS